MAQVNTTRPNVDRLASKTSTAPQGTVLVFLCFRKKVPFAEMAARREWRAAGRDVAQVREGAETARASRSGVGGVWKKRGCARERSGFARKRLGTLWKKRGCGSR